jgi:hypothetical protein
MIEDDVTSGFFFHCSMAHRRPVTSSMQRLLTSSSVRVFDADAEDACY